MGSSILIVDDQALNRRLLSVILQNEGYELQQARDGEEAVRLATANPPELVLLDIVMPAKNGFEVCEELQSSASTAEVPIIFLTSLGETADKIKGLSLGAADYITKPFNRGEVLARVHTQLRLRQLHRALRQQNKDLAEKKNRLEEGLRAASTVQAALMPRPNLRFPGLELAWRFLPCDEVGGDIFNLFTLPDGSVGLYLLDVSGHGVPSAMVTVSVAQSLSLQAGIVCRRDQRGEMVVTPPAEVLSELDQEYPTSRFDKYFTIAYLILELEKGRMRYSTAAHPPPILLRANGDIRLLEAGGPIIGLGALLPFDESEEKLEVGDRLFLYSDGIVEHEGKEGLFGAKRLIEALSPHRDKPLDQVCQSVLEAIDQYSDSRSPQDDISLFAAEVTGFDGHCRGAPSRRKL